MIAGYSQSGFYLECKQLYLEKLGPTCFGCCVFEPCEGNNSERAKGLENKRNMATRGCSREDCRTNEGEVSQMESTVVTILIMEYIPRCTLAQYGYNRKKEREQEMKC